MDSLETFREINENYNLIVDRAKIASEKAKRNFDDIKIIAVSKTHPAKIVEIAYNTGIRVFGENYVQEFIDKHEIIADKGLVDLEWHYIGHLQTNKVKYIAPFVNMIHSVDSVKLAAEIDKRAALAERNIDILIQLNTSSEPNKSGCDTEQYIEIAGEIDEFENITIKGLMTIGTFTDDERIQRAEFSLLRNSLEEANRQLGKKWTQLSMGMTGDFEIAIDEGATMVRIGTAIFGNRIYKNFGQ
jgi:pyridoxal phosphate enzyme (YggS family)